MSHKRKQHPTAASSLSRTCRLAMLTRPRAHKRNQKHRDASSPRATAAAAMFLPLGAISELVSFFRKIAPLVSTALRALQNRWPDARALAHMPAKRTNQQTVTSNGPSENRSSRLYQSFCYPSGGRRRRWRARTHREQVAASQSVNGRTYRHEVTDFGGQLPERLDESETLGRTGSLGAFSGDVCEAT